MATGPRRQLGVVFPSPVVMLSIIAVAMAAVAFFATRGGDGGEREIATPVRDQVATSTPSSSPDDARGEDPTEQPTKKPKPVIKRGQTFVEVYNNTGITGLAGRVATTAGDAGWNVVGSDNWVGTIPTNTVYFPARLKPEARQLARDLGIARTAPAVGSMKLDRLTVILTSEL